MYHSWKQIQPAGLVHLHFSVISYLLFKTTITTAKSPGQILLPSLINEYLPSIMLNWGLGNRKTIFKYPELCQRILANQVCNNASITKTGYREALWTIYDHSKSTFRQHLPLCSPLIYLWIAETSSIQKKIKTKILWRNNHSSVNKAKYPSVRDNCRSSQKASSSDNVVARWDGSQRSESDAGSAQKWGLETTTGWQPMAERNVFFVRANFLAWPLKFSKSLILLP